MMVAMPMAGQAQAADSIASGAQPASVKASTIQPSALLTIDQNRAMVVDRIVATWGSALAEAGVGLTKDSLHGMLSGLRSDHLLAASLAGSLEGLRNVLANALTVTAPVKASLMQAKALGDAGDDLVYTPVVPCRLADTRVAGGTLASFTTRDFKVWVSSGGFTAQGGDAGNCNVPANPAAVVLNFAAVSPAGFGNLIAYPTGAALPNTSMLNYQNGTFALSNGAIIPACVPNCANQLSVKANGEAVDVVIDIVGYFKPPGGAIGTVSSVATGTGLTGGPITTTGTISIANGGVGTAQIAPNAVTNALLAVGAVGTTEIQANSVTQAKLSPLIGAAPGKVLGTDGTNLQWQTDATGGSVTAVTASPPIASSGGSAPNISLSGTIPVANGGTGQATLALNGVLVGQGTGAVATAGGIAGQVLAGTAGAPVFTGSPSLSGNLSLVESTATTGNILKGSTRFIHNFGTSNIFIGENAGNFTMTGSENVATGNNALAMNTSGNSNTAHGNNALANNKTGTGNTASGADALGSNAFGTFNTATGVAALFSNINGTDNMANGYGALYSNTHGNYNIANGTGSLYANDIGINNTAIGYFTLNSNTQGNFNTAIGSGAGENLTTGSYNIMIGHSGIAAEAATIRIGNVNQTRAFVSGIYGVTTVGAAIPVVIASSGQLGTVSSSRRYKDDIADMGDATKAFMKLRPVTFHYKSDRNPKGRTLQYGLIAEEVAEVYPDLVARSADGRIETVMYQFLTPMLLNEVQRQQRTIEAQAARIHALEKQAGEIATLKQQVAKMAALQGQAAWPSQAAGQAAPVRMTGVGMTAVAAGK